MVSNLVIFKFLGVLLLFMDQIFTHFVFLLLTSHCCRKASHKFHILRDLVVGYFVLAEFIYVVVENVGTVIKFDQSNCLFTIFWIRDSNNLDIVNSWHSPQILLYLLRINVLASSDDHVLDSTHNSTKTMFVNSAKISCLHPTIHNGFTCCFLISPVANHYRVSTNQNLTRLPYWLCLALLIYDFSLKTREDTPNSLCLLSNCIVWMGLE